MKTSSLILASLFFVFGLSSAFAQSGCNDISLGSQVRIVLELKPGVPESVRWDFSLCDSGIQNFVASIVGPRRYPGGPTTKLSKSLPISIVKSQSDDGVDTKLNYVLSNFNGQFGTLHPNSAMSFTRGVGELEIVLDAKAKNSVFIEIITSYAIGGVDY